MVRFLYSNDYVFAWVLSLFFIVNHYFIVAALLSYQLWFYITDSLKRDIDRELLRQEMDEAGDLKAIEELKLKSNWFLRAMNNPYIYWTVLPIVIFVVFCITVVAVPFIDIFMLAFDVLVQGYSSEKGREAEGSNPLVSGSLFIYFLLQYRTLRKPLQVLLQSLPQTVLTGFLFWYIQRNPPIVDQAEANNSFSLTAVLQAVVASALNLFANGFAIYLAAQMSGKSFLGYIQLTLTFKGAADLPPEWDEALVQPHMRIDKMFHSLELPQQMKILQAAIRRRHLTLRTPPPREETEHEWLGFDDIKRLVDTSDLLPYDPNKLLPTSLSSEELEEMKKGFADSVLNNSASIIFDHRKMFEWLYEWDEQSSVRRLPQRIVERNTSRPLEQKLMVNIKFHRLHMLPLKPKRDRGEDMGMNDAKVAAHFEAARTEAVALWLITNKKKLNRVPIENTILHRLVHVRLNDCNIDASLVLSSKVYMDFHQDTTHRERPGPIIDLLSSSTLKILDLSDNPLFDLRHNPIEIDEKEFDTFDEAHDDELFENDFVSAGLNHANSPYSGPIDEKERLKMEAARAFAKALVVSPADPVSFC